MSVRVAKTSVRVRLTGCTVPGPTAGLTPALRLVCVPQTCVLLLQC
jgi:hypothetical protein